MNIDWNQMEEVLYELSAHDIRAFAKAHSNETFCSFFLDCNADYGEVLVCLNTEEARAKSADYYHQKYPESYKSVESAIEMLRLSPGDWEYQGFNFERWDEKWDSFRDAVEEAILDEEERAEEEDGDDFVAPSAIRFLEIACRVAIRLDQDGVLECLNRTTDFSVMCADHDESNEESLSRFAHAKQAMGNG
jgi:hypothetical protein